MFFKVWHHPKIKRLKLFENIELDLQNLIGCVVYIYINFFQYLDKNKAAFRKSFLNVYTIELAEDKKKQKRELYRGFWEKLPTLLLGPDWVPQKWNTLEEVVV